MMDSYYEDVLGCVGWTPLVRLNRVTRGHTVAGRQPPSPPPPPGVDLLPSLVFVSPSPTAEEEAWGSRFFVFFLFVFSVLHFAASPHKSITTVPKPPNPHHQLTINSRPTPRKRGKQSTRCGHATKKNVTPTPPPGNGHARGNFQGPGKRPGSPSPANPPGPFSLTLLETPRKLSGPLAPDNLSI